MEEQAAQDEVPLNPNRLVYKLHPTFVVLRSQQLNMSDAMNQNREGESNQDHNTRLMPEYNIPIQIVIPDNSTELGSRQELVSRDEPTVLPHTYQQLPNGEEEMSGEEQLRRHLETTQQQQQSIFTGPFLLYRTPAHDHKILRRLQLLFYLFAIIDIFVLIYLHFGVFYFPFLSKIQFLEFFWINTNNEPTRKATPARLTLEIIQFCVGIILNVIGFIAARNKNIRLLTIFIVFTIIGVIIELLTFISLFTFVQVFCEAVLLFSTSGIRTKLVSLHLYMLLTPFYSCIHGTLRINFKLRNGHSVIDYFDLFLNLLKIVVI
jgi:hypothetical protein